jgi:hypothetical protein
LESPLSAELVRPASAERALCSWLPPVSLTHSLNPPGCTRTFTQPPLLGDPAILAAGIFIEQLPLRCEVDEHVAQLWSLLMLGVRTSRNVLE